MEAVAVKVNVYNTTTQVVLDTNKQMLLFQHRKFVELSRTITDCHYAVLLVY